MASYFTINVCAANIYGKDNFDSNVLTQALLGESSPILDESVQWVKIRQADGYEGWINRFFGVISDKLYGPNYMVDELTSFVYADSELSLPSRELTYGNQLVAEKLEFGWEVTLPDGSRGFTQCKMRNNFPSLARESLITLTRKFLGIQYLWGGKSPKGFDCSGLVQAVFNTFGILLPRDSGDQSEFFISNKIARNDVKIGDLHFFGKQNKVTHIAIASSKKRYIHCQGFVKEESFDRTDHNFNADLLNTYLHSVSVKKVFKKN